MAVHTFPIVNPRSQQVSVSYIADRLGMRESTIKTIVARIRELIDRRGFPPPLGYRKWAGEFVEGAAAVTMRSFWRRDAVDAFFDGHGTTPVLDAAVADRALAHHSAALDANAEGIAA